GGALGGGYGGGRGGAQLRQVVRKYRLGLALKGGFPGHIVGRAFGVLAYRQQRSPRLAQVLGGVAGGVELGNGPQRYRRRFSARMGQITLALCMPNLQAFVFDLDGVILDNTLVQARAFQLLFRDLDVDADAYQLLRRLNGMPATDILKQVLEAPASEKELKKYAD
nr:hypothetical protein [Tanacetum cinerariifolium]